MAVFTPLPPAQLASFLRRHYGAAAAAEFCPISEGIENTNYKVVVDGKPFVFTVFEVWDAKMVDYYAALMSHLAQRRLPVPAPLATKNGAVAKWENKPCLLVPFVDGTAKQHPVAADCFRVGKMLAKLHIATAGFYYHRDNPRNVSWRRAAAKKLAAFVSAPAQKMLDEEILRDAVFAGYPLPMTACHCDLFRGNVLWQKNRVAAIIDFYFGGEESLIYDLAVCACDWCYDDESTSFNEKRLNALLAGYEQRRALCELEREKLSDAFCIAALRFWLSRLYDWHFPRRAKVLTAHDPARFENILKSCRARPSAAARQSQKIS